MTDAEPANKKRKYSDIFEQVLQKKLNERLDLTLSCLERGQTNLIVREIKVKDANANRAVSFSRASLGMCKFEDKYPLAAIFARGHAVLRDFVQSDISNGHVILPEDANCRKALELLLNFLDEHDQGQGAEFLICKDKVEEWQWKLELAQHVFSKLAINPTYKYDISRSYDETLGCPCPVHETMIGERGDTSFGCEKGWHGKIDILMADVPICPVLCEEDFSEPLPSSSASETSDTSSSNGIEVNKNMFNDNDYSQIVAETITFSFLKNKGKSNEDVTLIPSIAINKEGVQCYFYDSISDVLLQSGFNKLVASNEKLEVNTIVLIWLTLNHQLFCTGTLQEMKSSGFQKLVENINIYKEQVKAPCRVSHERDQMCISDQDWGHSETNSVQRFKNAIQIPNVDIGRQKSNINCSLNVAMGVFDILNFELYFRSGQYIPVIAIFCYAMIQMYTLKLSKPKGLKAVSKMFELSEFSSYRYPNHGKFANFSPVTYLMNKVHKWRTFMLY